MNTIPAILEYLNLEVAIKAPEMERGIVAHAHDLLTTMNGFDAEGRRTISILVKTATGEEASIKGEVCELASSPVQAHDVAVCFQYEGRTLFSLFGDVDTKRAQAVCSPRVCRVLNADGQRPRFFTPEGPVLLVW